MIDFTAEHLTKGDPSWDKGEIKKETEDLLDELYDLTKRLYAEGKQGLLIILQGMDASGKDGLTRTLFSKTSPGWVNVNSFKKPTDEELAHDFLWRVHAHAPEKGMVGVFNRSHYEDILVPTVYNLFPKEQIERRYDHINNYETYLEDNGIKIVKFFLNVSYDKQHEKLMERVENPEKMWKHSDGDWTTRDNWDKFMDVYQSVLTRCNEVPWHILPSDKNWTKLYTAAKVVVAKLKEMNPQFPPLDSEKF